MEDNLLYIQERTKILLSSHRQNLIPLINNHKDKVANPVALVEKVLISKLKAGDYSTFSSIFSAYYPDLVLFAERFTHDLNNAEDIVQDSFVKLWEEHESIKVDYSLKSYLLKIVQNNCIDWYRHKKIKQAYNNSVIARPPQLQFNTENYILFSELHEQIEIALGMLPVEVAEVFRMNRNEGLKYHEIANLLKVSVRTIEVRIGKALHMLRNYLKEYFILIISFFGLLFCSNF